MTKARHQIRALTLHQPWAFCVVHRGKRIENRDWPPPDWLIGQYLAIHAGKTVDAEAIDMLEHDPASPAINTTMPAEYTTGAIVAVAKVERVVTESDDPWFRGPFGWVLSEVVAIEPVPARGYQKLWPMDATTLAEVRKRFKAAREKRVPAKPAAPQPVRSKQAEQARAAVARAAAAAGAVEPVPVAAPKPVSPERMAVERSMRRERGLRSGGAFPMDQRARYAKGSSTSRRAAESIQEKLNGLQARVYAHIVACGANGATTDEIEVALKLSHQTASARVVELREDLGYVFDPGPERPTRSGRAAMVHVAREFLPRNVQEKLFAAEQQQRMF